MHFCSALTFNIIFLTHSLTHSFLLFLSFACTHVRSLQAIGFSKARNSNGKCFRSMLLQTLVLVGLFGKFILEQENRLPDIRCFSSLLQFYRKIFLFGLLNWTADGIVFLVSDNCLLWVVVPFHNFVA